MKTIVAFAALVAVAIAAPQFSQQSLQSQSPQPQPLISQQLNQPEVVLIKETPLNNIGVGDYKYAYELSDGQKREEYATIEYGSKPEEAILRVRGSFSYYNPYDGQTYTVNYIADENGFQPQGAHIPSL